MADINELSSLWGQRKKNTDINRQKSIEVKNKSSEPTKQVAFTPTKSPNFVEGGTIRNENFRDKIDRAYNKIGTPIDTAINAITLGVPDAIQSRFFPEQYEVTKAERAKTPVLTNAINMVGMIAPGVAIEKAAVKSLPYVFKGLKPSTELAARGIVGGAGVGAVEGLTEGIRDSEGFTGTLKNMGDKSYNYGLAGGLLAPAAGKVGELFKNRQTTNSLQNIDNAYSNLKSDGIFGAKTSATPTYSNTLQMNKLLDDLKVGTRLRNVGNQKPLALKPARVPDSEVIFGNHPSNPAKINTEPLQLGSGQKPLMLKEGTFLQPPVKPVGLGDAPQGRFNIKPTEIKSNKPSFEEFAKNNKDYQKAVEAANKASKSRMDLGIGASRARVTSANARWSSAAEYRDRLEINAKNKYDELYSKPSSANPMRTTFEKGNIPLTRENISLFEKDLQRSMNEAIERQSQILQKDGKRGVESWIEDVRGTIRDNSSGYVRKGGSLNEPWYSEAYNSLGRKVPSGKDYKGLSEKYLKEGYETSQGMIPPDEYFLGLQKQLDDLNSLKNELGFKNVSDFKTQNKTLAPIKKYAQQMEQYNNQFPKQEPNFKIEKPFKAFPAEVKNVNVPPKVPSQFSKEMFPKLPNMKDVGTKSKPLPVEPNLSPIKNEVGINSPSSKNNALESTAQSKLDILEQNYRKNINNIKNNKFIDSQMKAKRLKAEGMKYSAEKRNLLQGDSLTPVEGGLTSKELANKTNKMNSNYSGKEVVTPDGEGIATGQSSFGKVGVKVNGEVKYYPKEQVQGKVNIEPSQQTNMREEISQSFSDDIIPPRQSNKNAAIGTGKMKNRQFIGNSALNSDAVPKRGKTELENKMPKYQEISNQKTLEEAQRIVDSNFDEAVSNFRASKKLNDAIDTATGEVIIQRAYAQGKYDLGNEMALNLAEKLTNAGQIVQAASIMKRMTPEGMLKHITKTLERNKGKSLTSAQSETIYKNMKLVQLAEQGNLKLIDIDLQLFGRENASLREQLTSMSREQGDSVLDAVTARQVSDAALDNVSFLAANNLPVTTMDKINAWRRMAMLANPKTHIRNFGGNIIMAGLRKTSDTIGSGLEKVFVKQGERTKSLGWSKDKDIVKAIDDDWLFHKKALMKGGKFDLDTVFLNNEKQIFDKGRLTKFIEKRNSKEYEKGIMEYLNSQSRDLLNASDNIFLQRAYKDALGGYMKANSLKTVTNEARLYAARRGYEAVFKQANEFSNWISKMKSKGGATGAILEAKIPFSKTPSNILMRGIEYSPLGIIKALYGAAKGKTAASVIEDFSKGATGSLMYGAGLWLAAMGWARTETSKSKVLKSLEGESGKQPYSIDTPFGNYTFEWAQPTSIPLAMGVATMEALTKKAKGEEDIKTHEVIMKGLASGGDTLFNTTMLRGIADMVGGKYGSPSEAILNVPADYIQQSIPSVLGMINRSFIDTTKRDVSGGFADLAKSKIPFLSKTVPAKINVYGEEEKQPGPLQQFLSPGTYKSDKSDNVTKELLRLNKATRETKFLPSMPQKQLTYQIDRESDSKKFLLKPKTKEDYAKQLGQAGKIKLDEVINSGGYEGLTDKEKVKLVDSTMNNVKKEIDKQFLLQQGIEEYESNTSRGGRGRNRSTR